MDFLELLGERIRSRIEASGARSVERFAHENEIPKSTLSELLNGKNNPRLTTLAKICAGLEISLSDLLRDDALDTWVRDSAPRYNPRIARQQPKAPRKRALRP